VHNLLVQSQEVFGTAVNGNEVFGCTATVQPVIAEKLILG
jgi:hypothetical protein